MAEDTNETVIERIPPAPKGMNAVAAEYWKRKCKDLKASGRLNTTLLESLACYCNLLSDMEKARTLMDGAWGQELFFKYQKAYNDAAKMQIQYAKEFYFTPASSKRTGPETKKKKKGFDLTNNK
jgi:phage terminase small subunit